MMQNLLNQIRKEILGIPRETRVLLIHPNTFEKLHEFVKDKHDVLIYQFFEPDTHYIISRRVIRTLDIPENKFEIH